jgi:hypothetical protein
MSCLLAGKRAEQQPSPSTNGRPTASATTGAANQGSRSGSEHGTAEGVVDGRRWRIIGRVCRGVPFAAGDGSEHQSGTGADGDAFACMAAVIMADDAAERASQDRPAKRVRPQEQGVSGQAQHEGKFKKMKEWAGRFHVGAAHCIRAKVDGQIRARVQP